MASSAHAEPSGACMCCYDDLEAGNYVEYNTSDASPWLPSKYCSVCLQMLMDSKFESYVSAVAKSTCEAELRRLMLKGPPVWIDDPIGLPVGEGEHVHSLWFSEDNSIRSAKVKGALEGDARQKLWDEQKEFLTKRKEGEAATDEEPMH
eukprot:m.70479 g.70479  ORF g.70479 m.70479 type:complete len:149 (-) comp50141_c0_seq1:124-570(-)